ncbi:MAG: polyketide cyclase [Methylocystaceae bacterium]|nr:MAG: polyketide cyclase [Methylocystaceae bacterium]
MMETIVVTKTIGAPVEKVWSAIRAIDGLDRWFPVIETSRVEGEGVGATRVLGLADGGELHDRVLEIADAERRFRYERFRSPFPVESYLGTVQVRDAGHGRSDVSWTVVIEAADDVAPGLAEFLHAALSDGIDGLEKDLR